MSASYLEADRPQSFYAEASLALMRQFAIDAAVKLARLRRHTARNPSSEPEGAESDHSLRQQHDEQRDRNADRGDRRGSRVEIPGHVVEQLDRQGHRADAL